MQELNEGTQKSATRRNRTGIVQLLKEFEQAENITVHDFCAMHNITTSSFYYWRKRHRTTASESSRFIALPYAASSPMPGNLPALFAEVRGIRLFQAVPAEYLKVLVS